MFSKHTSGDLMDVKDDYFRFFRFSYGRYVYKYEFC